MCFANWEILILKKWLVTVCMNSLKASNHYKIIIFQQQVYNDCLFVDQLRMCMYLSCLVNISVFLRANRTPYLNLPGLQATKPQQQIHVLLVDRFRDSCTCQSGRNSHFTGESHKTCQKQVRFILIYPKNQHKPRSFVYNKSVFKILLIFIYLFYLCVCVKCIIFLTIRKHFCGKIVMKECKLQKRFYQS